MTHTGKESPLNTSLNTAVGNILLQPISNPSSDSAAVL